MTDQLLPYYNQELDFLRKFGAEFAAAHPKIAGRLRLGDDLSEDPHTSRIIEAFALLAARTRLKIDDDFPEITHAILGVLYPHYLAPMPSTAIVQFALDRRQADLVAGHEIAAGETIETEATSLGVCKFKTAYPVRVLPIDLTQAQYSGQPFQCPPSASIARSESCLHLGFKSFRSSVPISSMAMNRIRFFIRGMTRTSADLYELIFGRTVDVILAKSISDPGAIHLGRSSIRPVGFSRDEALLPEQPRTFNGYRLLTEYFAAPEKFMFFDIDGLTPDRLVGFGSEMHLFVLMDRDIKALEPFVGVDTIRTGCTPMINLFEQRAEPIRVTHRATEYRVAPDARQPRGFEVHTVTEVIGMDQSKKEMTFHPFYSIRHRDEASGHRGFYHVHRRTSEMSGGEIDRATEVYLSLVDLNFQPEDPPGMVLNVKALCTSRNLPGLLEYGSGRPRLELATGGPLEAPRCVTPPSESKRPPLDKGLFWRLISHLSLGHVSLFDQDQGATALREILALYSHFTSRDGLDRIDSLRSVSYRPSVARCPIKDASGATVFCRGFDINLTIDEDRLSTGGSYLFGAVMEQFLSLYASINSFTRVTLSSTSRETPIAQWPARSGRKTLL